MMDKKNKIIRTSCRIDEKKVERAKKIMSPDKKISDQKFFENLIKFYYDTIDTVGRFDEKEIDLILAVTDDYRRKLEATYQKYVELFVTELNQLNLILYDKLREKYSPEEIKKMYIEAENEQLMLVAFPDEEGYYD